MPTSLRAGAAAAVPRIAGGSGLQFTRRQQFGIAGSINCHFGLRFGGAWLGRIKDRIDRNFMAMFTEGAAMAQPLPPTPRVEGLVEAMGPKPLCGGCGAKLGAAGLASALATLPAPTARSNTSRMTGRSAACRTYTV